MDAPKIIKFNRIFHYKPSFFGIPHLWKHPHTTHFWAVSGRSKAKSHTWTSSVHGVRQVKGLGRWSVARNTWCRWWPPSSQQSPRDVKIIIALLWGSICYVVLRQPCGLSFDIITMQFAEIGLPIGFLFYLEQQGSIQTEVCRNAWKGHKIRGIMKAITCNHTQVQSWRGCWPRHAWGLLHAASMIALGALDAAVNVSWCLVRRQFELAGWLWHHSKRLPGESVGHRNWLGLEVPLEWMITAVASFACVWWHIHNYSYIFMIFSLRSLPEQRSHFAAWWRMRSTESFSTPTLMRRCFGLWCLHVLSSTNSSWFKPKLSKYPFALAQGRAVIHLGRHRHGRQLSGTFLKHWKSQQWIKIC